ncbi:MAG: hypothetical protein K2L46_03440, partial [Paramuribaculum sp.]|nr:hypothetical protein [Paramuribaculum sp.]
YCYEWHKDSRLMSWDQARHILESEFLSCTEEIDSVDLLGGEPLMNFPLIKKISDWVWDNSPSTKIFARTNGTLLNEEMKQWFTDNRDRFILGLSLDGTPEMNKINRGFMSADLKFFLANWPGNPIKMTLFPSSIQYLHESLIHLYSQGAEVIAGLAQGVLWDDTSCKILGSELDKLNDYYLSDTNIPPVEPLYDLNFEKAFWVMPLDIKENACWNNANIHSYDCDGERLPCHMFSTIVQGSDKRSRILRDMISINEEIVCDECRVCPIRWSCKNCMAMNYQHTGDFGKNINLRFSCEAQKIVAEASAVYLIGLLSDKASLSELETEKLGNAIKYYRLRHSVS